MDKSIHNSQREANEGNEKMFMSIYGLFNVHNKIK